MTENTASFIDLEGKQTEVTLDVTDYRAAADNKLTLTQYYAQKYPTKSSESTLEQFAASAGIRVRPDHKRGIAASSIREIMYGGVDKSAGTIVRGTGADRQTTTGRILFSEIMLQMVNEVLIQDKEDVLAPWESAIAMKTNVVGPRVDQPRINVTGPESSAAQPIAQLARPATMVSITLSDKSYTIPTKSIGLQISEQAQEASTIDLVAISLAAQARGERIRRIEEDMVNIISGDVDYGINAVSFSNVSAFDSNRGSNAITHKAWLKWLRANYQKMSISHVLCDLDAMLDIEARYGKPLAYGDLSTVPNRVPGDYTLENAGIPTPRMLLLPTSIVGASRAVGFDSRYALHQITNLSASYSAVENLVMRRASEMRFDYGTALFKLMDEAFTGLTLGA